MRNRKFTARVIATAALMALPAIASAVTFTWDGSTTSGYGYFSEPDNWVGNAAPPTSGADLIFGVTNTHGYGPTMNTSYAVNSLTFNSSAVAYTIGGSPGNLTTGAGGLTDNASNNETISAPVYLSTSQGWNVTAGSLLVSNNLTLNTFALSINNSGTATFNGSISGTVTAGLTKLGPGNLALNSGGSFPTLQVNAGAAQVNGGTLTLTNTLSGLDVSGGSLTVENGATLNGNASTGVEAVDGSSAPSMNVTGNSTKFLAGAGFNVGSSNSGMLSVYSNATVSVTNAFALGVSNGSNGNLQLAAGGSLTCSTAVFGQNPGSTFLANIYQNATTFTVTNALDLGGGGATGGSGTMTVSQGAAATAGSTNFYSNTASMNINGGTMTTAYLNSGSTGNGAISLTDPTGGYALTLNGSSAVNNYSGSISGPGSIIKSSGSTQSLSGNNAFTGVVIVQGGTLSMSSGTASVYDVYNAGSSIVFNFGNFGSSAIEAFPGASIVCNTDAITGGNLIGGGNYNVSAVSVISGTSISNGASITPAAGANLVAVTNAGTITNPPGNVLFLTGGSNAGGNLNVSGTTEVNSWTSSGIVQVNAGGIIQAVYTNVVLLAGSRTYIGTANAPGGSITFYTSGATIELNGGLLVNYGSINAGVVDVNFGGLATGTGSYSGVVVNPGGTYSPGTYTAASVLPQSATSFSAIQPASAGATSVSNPITVNATANISVNGTDSLTLTSAFTTNNNPVIKLGTGAVTLPAFATTASVNISAGTMQIASSTGTLQAGTLSITPGGVLDLTNNTADISGSTLASITALVQSGFNAGHWNGSGIISSIAASNNTHLTTVGTIQNNQSGTAIYTASHQFEGATPGAGDVLLKYTYYGDTNLDGSVDGTDYSRIDAAYLADRSNPTASTGWYNGDFNYDGVINGSDYTLIDNAFNRQGAQLSAEIAAPTAQIAGTAVISAVPEPATLTLMGIGLLAALSRRRIKTA